MKRKCHLWTVLIASAFASIFCPAISVQAQLSLRSVVPANGQTGVSTTAPVVFTFSEEMDVDATTVMFINFANPLEPISVNQSWNPGLTVLTCTPNPAFPANVNIFWTVDATSLFGDTIDPTPFGNFTTSSGGGGSSSNTNQYTGFSAGKMHFYHQTNDVLTLDDQAPYVFAALTSLASNRTATSISLTLPTSVTLGLTNWFLGPPEDYQLLDFYTDLTSFEGKYPAGNYTFTMASTPPSTPAIVSLPTSMQQPNAPQVSNWAALQAANPTQAVTISWSAFQGATSSDYIQVEVGQAFKTPDVGKTNALKGTQTSVVIPAGQLQNNTGYDSTIVFYRTIIATNQAKAEVTEAYRATSTSFTVQTSTSGGGQGNPVQLSTPAVSGGKFGFEIVCTPGQTFTVEASSTMLPGSWLPLMTTNPVGTRVLFQDNRSLADQQYYRARNGS
jgi:hypothetical protein